MESFLSILLLAFYCLTCLLYTSSHKIVEEEGNGMKYLRISLATAVILLNAVSPSWPGVFCNLVLIVSIGAFESGPIEPEIKPMMVVW